MLTIEGINNVGIKEFSFLGNEWVLYKVFVLPIEYKFIFIPMLRGQYDMLKNQIVILNRNKTHNKGYRLWTTNGMQTYINTNQIPNWQGLVEQVWRNRMIC